MLDNARLRLLGEMGIDVYVPRSLRGTPGIAGVDASMGTSDSAVPVARENARARVALIARPQERSEETLLAQTRCALKFARIDGVVGDALDAGDLGDTLGMVVFGKSLAREVGAALPADRAKRVHWISAADVASIVGNADGKRALWSELRRMIRTLQKSMGELGG